ncbi:MAG: hypothetical protein ABR83_05575 [Cryomorphaceae bacterium BACL18 MAG-120924-bin36]|jgi:hypothetical protein|nr:MAG: hypothetical protein ABR83_05575 [Cryomorphaceae bacterium BACL18 MAG-120924-bin36]
MDGGQIVKARSFWLWSIGFLMLSMFVSIVVGEEKHALGFDPLGIPWVRNLYAGIKIALGLAYVRIVGFNWLWVAGLVIFALVVRTFAEGTFTVALIGAAMAYRTLGRE